MALMLFVLIGGTWIIYGRRRWAIAGLSSATLLWIFGTCGGHLWNASRHARGSGLPPKMIADTSLESPAANALLWASAGTLLGVVVMAVWLYIRREHASRAVQISSRGPATRPLADIMRPTWLLSASGLLFVAWALGQGLSLWSRDSYLLADGIGFLRTATTTPAPLIGATAFAASLISPASRHARALAIALGVAWWICTLSAGTRLAILFPLAIVVALVARLVRAHRSRTRLVATLALSYVAIYLAIYSFGITLEVREVPHGISRLPELFAYDGRPGLFQIASWGPIVLKMVSSVASSYVITHHSVLHPPPAEILWMNANPLPQAIAGIDAFSYERMWPLSWVPLSMVGEWYGVYGPIGQLCLYGSAALVGAFSTEYLFSRKQQYFAALALVLAIATIGVSIQYPSRWFWRLFSLLAALPVVYAFGTWMLSRIRSSASDIRRRRQQSLLRR